MTTHRIERTEDLLADGVLSSDRPKLVLSPHLDDAILSAYAVIAQSPCEVWTVFAGQPSPAQTTSWDLSCGFPDSDHTMAARLAEDEAAFRSTNASVRRIPALDGAYTTPERRRADLGMIRTQLDAWMSAHPDGIVVAPVGAGLHVPPAWWQRAKSRVETLRTKSSSAPKSDTSPAEEAGLAPENPPSTPPPGSDSGQPTRKVSAPSRLIRSGEKRLGGLVKQAMHMDAQRRRRKVLGTEGLAANPDHLDVRDLVLDVARAHSSVQIVLFEDLPYLWHERGTSEVARLETAHRKELRPFTLPVDRDTKYEHLRAYTSQMPVMDSSGRLLQASTLPSTEDYWVVP